MHPVCVDLKAGLDWVRQEANNLEALRARLSSEQDGRFADPVLHWMAIRALGFGIEKVYGGMEHMLKRIAADIDGGVPRHEAWQSTLLRRMASNVPGARLAVIGEDTLDRLNEVLGFLQEDAFCAADLDASRLMSVAGETVEALSAFERDVTVFCSLPDAKMP